MCSNGKTCKVCIIFIAVYYVLFSLRTVLRLTTVVGAVSRTFLLYLSSLTALRAILVLTLHYQSGSGKSWVGI